jgi:hypothetical protein
MSATASCHLATSCVEVKVQVYWPSILSFTIWRRGCDCIVCNFPQAAQLHSLMPNVFSFKKILACQLQLSLHLTVSLFRWKVKLCQPRSQSLYLKCPACDCIAHDFSQMNNSITNVTVSSGCSVILLTSMLSYISQGFTLFLSLMDSLWIINLHPIWDQAAASG